VLKNIIGREKMRGVFIVIIFLLGFFILTSGIKIIEERMKTQAAAIEEIK